MILLWFRQDLRLHDNPALSEALHAAQQTGAPILPLYILDDETAGAWAMGGASRWWLHHSLSALAADLQSRYGLTLHIFKGHAENVLNDIADRNNAQAIYWNRCYEPWRIARDKQIKTTLKDAGLTVHSFNAALLWEPHTIKTAAGTPYKVFTPFYRKGCLQAEPPAEPLDTPAKHNFTSASDKNAIKLEALQLIPQIKWYAQMQSLWQPGEAGANQRFQTFLEDKLCGYKEGRNFPEAQHTSCLSPHLHFGEISPRHVWHTTRMAIAAEGLESDGDNFLSEIGWREFSYYLLYHFPALPRENFQSKFNAFPWNDPQVDKGEALRRWQRGQTGYPIVDAGMRELWQTGTMHNRVRMIVGSFLVKHLRLHWHHGEDWFWDTLLDADLANNSASWQWIAGCGADAAPYFRIFNPITQGQKFDASGAYTRRFVPELKDMPDKYLFNPWDAPDHILKKAGVALGKDYPKPIVNHSAAREEALSAFSSLKTSG